MMPLPPSKNQEGMTLLEVIIAITILSFITLAIANITSNSVELKDMTVKEDQEMLQVEKAFYRFSFDFEQIYSPLFHRLKMVPVFKGYGKMTPEQISKNNLIAHYQAQDDFNALSQTGEIIPKIYQDGKSTLAFYSASNRRKYENIKESTYAWILYTVEEKEIINDLGEQEKTQAFVRYFSAQNPFEKPIWKKRSRLKSQILLTGVEKLVFKFWNPLTEKYVEDLSVVEGGENLIRGLEVTLHWKRKTGVEEKEVRYFRPSWIEFIPESPEEIMQLQNNIRRFGKNKNKAKKQ